MKRYSKRVRAFIRAGTGLQLLLSVLLLANVASALAQTVTAVFVAPSEPLTAGRRGSVWLYCMNTSSNYVSRTFEPTLNCTLISQSASFETVLLLNTSSSPMAATIPPGGFVTKEYLLELPLTSSGQATLDIPRYNQVEILVAQASAGITRARHTPPASSAPNSELWDYFVTHVSFYEPIYFILGTYPAGEFQFSLKYKLLAFKDNWDPLTHLYFGYTQTSFWDVLSRNPSFYDTSYKPSIFLYYPDAFQKEYFQLDLQSGAEHESNGRGGTLERSLNTIYLQPKATVDLPYNFQLSLQPRAWLYVRTGDNNQNIADYRGYVNLLAALTWLDPNSAEKIQLAAKYTIGDQGTHPGLLYDLRFNLASLPVLRRFNPSIQVQYFTGYGQTLAQYNQTSHAFRAGLCLWY